MSNDLSLVCGRLRVVFRWRGDRYEHQIELRSGERPMGALLSEEGSGNDHWPASPPFQSLHFETRPDGRRLAFLVGMAGDSHWSASVETDPIPERITFDVACRLKREPTRLGAVYRLSKSDSAATALRIIVPTDLAVPEAALETAENQLTIRVRTVAGKLPRTMRWRYFVTAEAEPPGA